MPRYLLALGHIWHPKVLLLALLPKNAQTRFKPAVVRNKTIPGPLHRVD